MISAGELALILQYIEAHDSYLERKGITESTLYEIRSKFRMIEGLPIESPMPSLNDSMGEFPQAYATDEYAGTLFGVIAKPSHILLILVVIDHYASQAAEMFSEKSTSVASAVEASSSDEDRATSASLYQTAGTITPPPRDHIPEPLTPIAKRY